MEGASKDLLHLESNNASTNPLESRLLVCNTKSQTNNPHPDGMCRMTPVLRSSVLDKVKGFLGDMAKANEQLQCEAKENPDCCNIEKLTGNESEVIEMNLMLGVADLNTPEAEAAAKITMPDLQPDIPLGSGNYETESDESSDFVSDGYDESSDGENSSDSENEEDMTATTSRLEDGKNRHTKKKARIVELS